MLFYKYTYTNINIHNNIYDLKFMSKHKVYNSFIHLMFIEHLLSKSLLQVYRFYSQQTDNQSCPHPAYETLKRQQIIE